MNLEDLKKLVASEKYKIISFDIFDTLLLRPSIYPTDILKLAGHRANASEFYLNIRKNSEQLARSDMSVLDEEITYDSIYEEMFEKYSFLKSAIEELKAAELDCELKYLSPRKSMKEVYECAKKAGKIVIITSDMYLPKEFTEKVLLNCGYINYNKLYLSSEYNLTKSSGHLYDQIILDFRSVIDSPSEIVHIGDNENSDVNVPQKLGITAVHIKRVEAMLHKDNKFKRLEMASERTCDNTFLLGFSANRVLDDPFTEKIKKDSLMDKMENINEIVISPMLVSFAKWIVSDCSRNKIKNLIFINAEGKLISKLISIIVPYIYPELQIQRIKISKKVWLYLNNSFISLFNNAKISPDDKIKTISRMLLLSEYDESVSKLFEQYGFKSGNDIIGDTHVLFQMAESLNSMYEQKREKALENVLNEIEPFGTQVGFYTDKYCDDMRKLAPEFNDKIIYSLFSDRVEKYSNHKFLGQLGQFSQRLFPKFIEFFDMLNDCSEESYDGKNKNGIYSEYSKKIIDFAYSFCNFFGDDINKMKLNAFQYFEYMKIASLEYTDCELKNLICGGK